MTSDTQLFELYFQKGKQYYLSKLVQYRSGRKFTFNIFSFFFGLFWFAYRKMYLQSVIILIIICAEGIADDLLLKNVTDTTSIIIDSICMLIVSTITGFIGNYLYLRQAENTIAKAKATYKDDKQLQKVVKSKGGVSYILLIIIVLAVVALFDSEG